MIETNRLLLIPLDIQMIDSLIESNDSFYEGYHILNDGGAFLNPSPEYLYRIRNRLIEHPEEYPFAVDYLIVIKEIKTVIGTIYFKSLPNNGISEIGYGMTRNYEGHGYMSEALQAMIEYGKRSGLTKVIADTHINNKKSQKVLNRNGFELYKVEKN